MASAPTLTASGGAIAAWLGEAVAAILFAFALSKLLGLFVAGQGGAAAALGWASLLILAAAMRGGMQGVAGILGLRRGAEAAAAMRHRIAPAMMTGAAGRGRLTGGDAELAVAGIDRIEAYVARFLPLRRAAAAAPLLVALAALSASWVAAAILLATLIPFAVGMALAGGAARAASEAQLVALSRLGGLFVDRVRALPLILSYGAEERVTRHIGGAARDLAARTLGVLRIAFLSSAILEFFSALAVALVAVYCGFSLLGLLPFAPPELLDFTQAFFVLALAPEFYLGMRRLAAAYHEKQQGEAALAALAGEEARLDQPAPKAEATRAPLSLRVAELVVRHPEGVAIGPLSADWRGPGLHVIAGASGAGKTSVLRALIGQVPVAAGGVWSGDDAIEPGAIAAQCGWAGQRPLLLPGTLRDNLLIERWGTDDAAALALLGELGLGPLLVARGGGLDWAIDDRGSGLSGGERRRIGLARALLAPRAILLVDEPTSDLDAASAEAIIALLRRAAATRLVIAATHDAAFGAVAYSRVEIA